MNKKLAVKYNILKYEIRKRLKSLFFPVALYLTKLKYFNGPVPIKVFITGAPRSGTSFLTGLVIKMGLKPGPDRWLKKADEHNRFGYFECLPLLELNERLIKKLGKDFFNDIPDSTGDWINTYKRDRERIKSIIASGGIEVYKENKFLVLAEFYHMIYPNAKWIFINRRIEDVHRSSFGNVVSFEKHVEQVKNQLAEWHKTSPSKKALYIDYEEFYNNSSEIVTRISSFLGIKLSQNNMVDCLNFFKPRNEQKQE